MIDLSKCIQCGACADVCPIEAIESYSPLLFYITYNCSRCEECVTACPVEAIYFSS